MAGTCFYLNTDIDVMRKHHFVKDHLNVYLEKLDHFTYILIVLILLGYPTRQTEIVPSNPVLINFASPFPLLLKGWVETMNSISLSCFFRIRNKTQ